MLYHAKEGQSWSFLHLYVILIWFCHFPTSLSVISPLLSLEFPLLLIPSCTSTAVQFLKAWMSVFRLYLNSLSIPHSNTVAIICNYLYSFLFLSSSLSVLDKHFKFFVLTRILILHLTAFSASFLLCSCNGEVCDLQFFCFVVLLGIS